MEVTEGWKGVGLKWEGCWGRGWRGSSGVSCFTFWMFSFFFSTESISLWYSSLVTSAALESKSFIHHVPLKILKSSTYGFLHLCFSWMYVSVRAALRLWVFILPLHDYLYANSRYTCVWGRPLSLCFGQLSSGTNSNLKFKHLAVAFIRQNSGEWCLTGCVDVTCHSPFFLSYNENHWHRSTAKWNQVRNNFWWWRTSIEAIKY